MKRKKDVSMFCGNCGANNPEGSSVCGSCGAALTPEKPKTGSKLPEGNKKIIGLAIVIGGAILALALVIWLIATLVGGGGAKGAAKQYITASIKGDAKALVELAGPKELLEEFMDDEDDFSDKGELIEDVKGRLEDAQGEYEDYFGKGVKVKVEVKKVKDWKNNDIKDYEDVLDEYDLDYEVKAGATVTLRVTVQGKDEKQTYKPELELVKVNGKWYVAGGKTSLSHDVIWPDAYNEAFKDNHKNSDNDKRVMLTLSAKRSSKSSED